MVIRTGTLLLLLAWTVGCPAQVEDVHALPAPVRPPPEAKESDPRVERRGEDLYPAKTLERHDSLKRLGDDEGGHAPDGGGDGDDAAAEPAGDGGDAPPSGLGSGRPDETNGVCRLYAPKLPDPACCEANLGFDVEVVKDACNLPLYMGESFQQSCGYYFLNKANQQFYFRLSALAEKNVASAIRTHYRQPAMANAPKAIGMGVPGVLRSRLQGLNWAFLPGLGDGDSVRLLTWRDGTCPEEGLKTVVEKLVAAQKPPEGAKRSLVPSAQY